MPSVSASSAEHVGNIMSGVTVAQIKRSTTPDPRPRSSSAATGRRQRDVGQRLVLRGDPPLADAGALR